MSKRNLFAVLGAFLLLTVIGCGGGSSGGGGGAAPPTFSLTFSPNGGGYSDGAVEGLKYDPAQTLDFTLEVGLTVTGQVTDGLGSPIDGADIEFRSSAAGPVLDADVTDGTGNYSVSLAAGTYVVELQSNVAEIGDIIVSGIVVSTPDSLVHDFQFPAEVALTGVVYEYDGSTPIANAELEFDGRSTGADPIIVANGSGAYTLDLVPDTYDVLVIPIGAAASTHLEQTFTVTVTAAGVQDFSLVRGVTVSGTIFDELAAAYTGSGLDIKVVLPDNSPYDAPPQAAINETTGGYSIDMVPPGTVYFELEADDDSGYPVQRITAVISGPTVQTVDMTLQKGFVLSGIMYEDDGTTPEDLVKIKAVPVNGSLEPDKDTTQGGGLYDISLFAGTYNLEIEPELPSVFIPAVQQITVTGDTDLNITLTRGVTLQGTVYLEDGTTPAPNVIVSVEGFDDWANDKTDGSGNYSMLVPVGTLTLLFEDDGGTLQDITLDPLSNVVTALPGPVTQDVTLGIAITGTNVVSGVVYAPDGITPVANVDIEARDENGKKIAVTTTDAFGAYTLVLP